MGADVKTVVFSEWQKEKKTDERVCHYCLEGCADTLRIYADLANTGMGKLYRMVIGGQGGSTPGVWGGYTGFGPLTAHARLLS